MSKKAPRLRKAPKYVRNKETVDGFLAELAKGAPFAYAAHKVGATPEAFYNLKKEDAEFAERIVMARKIGASVLVMRIFRGIVDFDDVTAAIKPTQGNWPFLKSVLRQCDPEEHDEKLAALKYQHDLETQRSQAEKVQSEADRLFMLKAWGDLLAAKRAASP